MNKVYFMGDIHQNFKPIRDLFQNLNLCIEKEMHPDISDTVVLLGDAGANFFFNYMDRNFKEKIGKYKFTYFIIRGNHEQRPSICAQIRPNEWETEEYFGNTVYVEKKYPYIKYALDYPALYNIKGHPTMVFPGAYSVDKLYRIKNNLGWFEGEQLTEAEKKIGLKMIKDLPHTDIVLSHTCPKIYQPTDLFLSVIDQSLVDDSMERYLNEVEYNLGYKLWLFGHYHQLRIYPQYEDKQMIMLSKDAVIDLDKYFETKNPYDSLFYIKNLKEVD